MLDIRKKIKILGTSSTMQPGNYNCDSCNIVYLLICDKKEHIGRLARMTVLDTEVDGSNPGSSMLFP